MQRVSSEYLLKYSSDAERFYYYFTHFKDTCQVEKDTNIIYAVY